VASSAGGTFNLAVELVDRQIARGNGASTALRCAGRTVTYATLAEEMDRVGNALRSCDVRPEERVAIVLHDSPELVATFFGAIKIGAVPVPLATGLTPADYRFRLADSGAAIVVVHESLASLLPEARSLRRLRHTIVVGTPRGGELAFADLVREASRELVAEPTHEDDMAYWLYSSGTTGQPKAVVHLHRSGAMVALLFGQAVIGIGERDRVLSASKLFFAFGLGNALLIPFSAGASSVLLPGRPEPRAIYEAITSERPTLFYAVPTMYAALLAVADTSRYDLSSLRLCVSAGEPLPPVVYERWRDRFGLAILDGLGSTELGHNCLSNFPGRVRPGTSGEVLPGWEVKIVDAQGAEAAPEEVGDLLAKGPSTAAFYWRRRDATKRTFRGEWVFTGDRYTRSADGYYTYVGRSDDVFKVAGNWVSPVEVEAALVGHDAVRECAVVGLPDENGLVKACAFVVIAPEVPASVELAAELRAFLSGRLAPHKLPYRFEFVGALPRTPSGKIQRFVLRSGLGAPLAADPARV
jgi:benzoate-CoA ligase